MNPDFSLSDWMKNWVTFTQIRRRALRKLHFSDEKMPSRSNLSGKT